MAIAPMLYDDSLSKIGSHVVPAFTVFQTPPEPTVAYMTLSSCGWIAISAIRPLFSAGPMARSERPDKLASLSVVCCADTGPAKSRTVKTVKNKDVKSVAGFFMIRSRRLLGGMRICCEYEGGEAACLANSSAVTIPSSVKRTQTELVSTEPSELLTRKTC